MYRVIVKSRLDNSTAFDQTNGDLEQILSVVKSMGLCDASTHITEITDLDEDYRVLRLRKYSTLIDPFLNEAVIENAGGRPEKLTALLALREAIRAEHPKPL